MKKSYGASNGSKASMEKVMEPKFRSRDPGMSEGFESACGSKKTTAKRGKS